MANGIDVRKLRREIARETVRVSRARLMAAWDRSPAHRLTIEPLDGNQDGDAYRCVPPATWNRILQHLGIHKLSYESDIRDCDDFAKLVWAQTALLRVNGVGLVVDYSGGHAYLAVVVPTCDGPVILFVEPQRDDPDPASPNSWWVRTPGAGAYNMDFGRALF